MSLIVYSWSYARRTTKLKNGAGTDASVRWARKDVRGKIGDGDVRDGDGAKDTPSEKGRLNAEGAVEVDELESKDVERRAFELPVSTTCNARATNRERMDKDVDWFIKVKM